MSCKYYYVTYFKTSCRHDDLHSLGTEDGMDTFSVQDWPYNEEDIFEAIKSLYILICGLTIVMGRFFG